MIPSQSEIVLRLAELSRLLDKGTQEIAELDEAAVRAKQAHEVASARAYLSAEGAVDTRKAIAIVTVAQYTLERELAEAKHRAPTGLPKPLGCCHCLRLFAKSFRRAHRCP